MKKLTVLCLLIYLSSNLAAGTEKASHSVYFSTASFSLNPISMAVLDSIASTIQAPDDIELIIHGHTDSRGGDAYNESLSKQRAEAVNAYFQARGVNPNLIVMDHFGEYSPIQSNADSLGLSKNRRVEITFMRYQFSSTSELEQALRPRPATSIISGRDEAFIEAKNGTKIAFEAGSFLDQYGQVVEGPVTVEVIEAFKMNDFVAYGLSTVSEGQLLESGGMIKVSAFDQEGKELQLNPLKPMAVSIPTAQREPGMELFYAEEGTEWEAVGQNLGDTLSTNYVRFPTYVHREIPELPIFQADLSNKPRHPVPPSRMMPPQKPQSQAFITTGFWKKLTTPRQRQHYFEEQYVLALEEYEKQLAEYYYYKDRFPYEVTAYNDRLYEHRLTMNAWEIGIECQEEDFEKSPEYMALEYRIDSIQALDKAEYNARVAEWQAKRSEAVRKNMEKMERLGKGTQQALNEYVFLATQLNWINIDRFYKPEMNETYTVSYRDTDRSEERVFMLFDEMNSLLPLHKRDANYEQANLPVSAPGEIFAYKVVDGQAFIFQEGISASGKGSLKFKPCKFADIRKAMEKLNS